MRHSSAKLYLAFCCLLVVVVQQYNTASIPDTDAKNSPPSLPLDADEEAEAEEQRAANAEAEYGPVKMDWLPPGGSIAEEAAKINQRNGVMNVIRGDILMPLGTRNAMTDKRALWPGGVIPYFVTSGMNSKARAAISSAVQEIERKSCVRFKKLFSSSGSAHHIRVMQGGGCYSFVGRVVQNGKPQDVSIGNGCEDTGIVIHEFMHAMGFFHEQSRSDRDQYVRIYWQNIQPGTEGNFQKMPPSQVSGLGMPYDYDGIMHYGATAFSKNGQPTIVRLNGAGPLGQRNGLSQIDAKQLNILYGCKGKPVAPGPGPVNPPGPNPPPSSGSGINSAICGKRSTGLQHPLMSTSRIVGGKEAKPGDWPWQVGIATASRFVFCGGTLISNEWVISAAHCFESSQTVYALLGEHDKTINEGNEEFIKFSKVIVHPGYNKQTTNNDIALLKLSRPVKFTKYIRPACVPDANFAIQVGKKNFVSGFGTTSEGGSVSRVLKVAAVPIVSDATCKSVYGNSRITTSMFCAGYAQGGTDSCQGDSGGPLVDLTGGRYYLSGVVSWGAGCAQAGKYGVYARVPFLRSWIDRNLPNIGKPVGPGPVEPPEPGPGPGPVKPPVTGESAVALTCPLESGLCNWQQAKDDSFDWTRRSGRTPSYGTGPFRAAGGKFYFYIESSSPRKPNEAASIRSPLVVSKVAGCLRFSANMFGASTGTLEVVNLQTGIVLFEKTGNQGKRWFNVKVDLPAKETLQIEISGFRGKSYTGDIAIDKLRYFPRKCSALWG